MSEVFNQISQSGVSRALKEKAEDIKKEFNTLSDSTLAILCKESSSKLVPAVAPTTTAPTASELPLYVYKAGSNDQQGTKYYGDVDVIGAAGLITMTIAANAGAVTAGSWLILTGSAGYVAPYSSSDTTNYQVVVGVAMDSRANDSTNTQEITVNSCVPRVVKLTA